MGRDTLTVLATMVLQHVQDAGAAMREGSVLVSLPTYLDATDVQLLQMEVNRWSVVSVELQHRPGERRVGVRLVAQRPRR